MVMQRNRMGQLEVCCLNTHKTCMWSELYSLVLLHLCRKKFSLGGNHIPGMKQKYISTIIFTSKLKTVDIWQKKNAYTAKQQGTHRTTCCVQQLTQNSQSLCMSQFIPNPTWFSLSLSLSHARARAHTHTHTHKNSDLIVTNMVHLLLARFRQGSTTLHCSSEDGWRGE
jgi:hypothetical protein